MSCPHGQSAASCAACGASESATSSSETLGETLIRGARTELELEAAGSPVGSEAGRIGRFVVIETAGRGGMGVVLSAYDPALDRRVAIKVLRSDRGTGPSDTGGTARLAREAQAMARLSHPNVVPVYDVGRTGDALFVAMEYVAGSTLHDWLRERPRSWREALAVLLQAGRGLEAAHAAGIVHRDFKPANVLVGADGRARVTDFGLARSQGDVDVPDRGRGLGTSPISLETPLTVAGAVMGSPGYMAPEQYAGQPTSAATDQYAFCVTLYEALYGRRPFDGKDLGSLARLSHGGVVPPPPSGSPVPPWLFDLVARGLSPDPAKRFSSMSELLAQLERDPSAVRRRRVVLALSGATALLLGAGLVSWPSVRASGCHRETERLAAVWDDAARAGVARAFHATSLPFAATTLDYTRGALDRFVEAWAAERHAACDESLRSRARTVEQLQLRLQCLDRRRTELATLARQLQQVDVDAVLAAPMAVARLTPVSRCANVSGLEARARLPEQAGVVVDEVEQQLAEGRMLVALGQYARARGPLEQAVASARRVGDPQTLGTALLELGVLEVGSAHFAEARADLEEASRRALESRDDRTALHAVALLTSVVGWRLGAPREALALAGLARGLVPRVDDLSLEALLDEGEGDSWWRLGDRQASLASYRRSLASLERLEGPLGLDVARLRSSVGWVLMEEGSLAEAREVLEASRRARERLLGVDHPVLGVSWNELGHLGEALGDLPAALDAYRRAHASRVKTPGVSPLLALRSHLNLARALVHAGQGDEARRVLAEVSAALDGVADVSSPVASMRTMLQAIRARLLLLTGDATGAERLAREALASEHQEDDLRAGAVNRTILAGALVAQRRSDEALELLASARRELEGLRARKSSELGEVVVVRASLLIDRDAKSPASLEAGREAVQACAALEGNEALKARAHLLLARAQWASGQRADALDSARAALALAPAWDPDDTAAAARQWLAAHAP